MTSCREAQGVVFRRKLEAASDTDIFLAVLKQLQDWTYLDSDDARNLSVEFSARLSSLQHRLAVAEHAKGAE